MIEVNAMPRLASCPAREDSRDSVTWPRTVAPAGISVVPFDARIGSVRVAVKVDPTGLFCVLSVSFNLTPKVVPAGTG